MNLFNPNNLTVLFLSVKKPSNTSTLYLKRQCHLIFWHFCQESKPPWLLINRQNWFCWKISFRGDIREIRLLSIWMVASYMIISGLFTLSTGVICSDPLNSYYLCLPISVWESSLYRTAVSWDFSFSFNFYSFRRNHLKWPFK